MNYLKVELKNCFGINHLEHNFNFNQKHSFLIYAPNGMMKSSFAKTFNLLAKNQKPCDQVYPERETIANVLCDEENIASEYIFVADAETDITTNDKVTTLLASKKLKTQYDSIYQQLDEAKSDFVKKLKSISQSTDCEEEIITTFAESKKDNFFECLEHAKNKVSSTINVFDFKYNDIFDKKGNVKKFLDKNKDLIQKYFEEYKRLITSSYFFSDNTNGPSFGTYQAKKLIDSVTGDAFFVAKHKIVLSNSDEISSSSMLEDLVNNEMNRILSDEKIKKAFEKIDNAIGANAELRAFKNVIEKDKSLIPYLTDYENFKKMAWYGYLYKTDNEYLKLLNLYNTKKHELAELLKEAKKENELWSDIIKIYKQRFFVPFDVSIENQDDVILKQATANLVFTYKDSRGDNIQKDKNELLAVLSRGEKRAFFILQLLFELEARKKEKQETLIIFDDIADSFDYKNKYAIIEYINELNRINFFYQIILTHNFDFYRTIASRLDLGTNVFMTIKTEDSITLRNGEYRNDYFGIKIKQAKQSEVFIALIPFVRNIIEYTEGEDSDNYKKLTSCLHKKVQSKGITVNDIWKIYNKKFNSCDLMSQPLESAKDKNIIDFIKEIASKIRNTEHTDEIKLENKLILSICVRLLAEEYMISILNDDEFLNSIQTQNNQTRNLFNEFCKKHAEKKVVISLLDRVNLITPEYIHLNSFMYEPLIDTSVKQLIQLYDEVLALKANK